MPKEDFYACRNDDMPHGFSTCDTSIQSRETPISVRVPNWVGDSIGWLREVLGDFGEGCMTEPVCKGHVTGDHEAFLSADCTIGCIMANPQAASMIAAMLEQLQSQGGTPGMNEDMLEAIQKMTLRNVLNFCNVAEAVVQLLDEQLRRIPNIG